MTEKKIHIEGSLSIKPRSCQSRIHFDDFCGDSRSGSLYASKGEKSLLVELSLT